MIGNWVEVVRTGNLSKEKEMDIISKWLIITRSCVFSMTLLSGFIGGMLAGIDGHFNLWFFLLVLLGLTLVRAHLSAFIPPSYPAVSIYIFSK